MAAPSLLSKVHQLCSTARVQFSIAQRRAPGLGTNKGQDMCTTWGDGFDPTPSFDGQAMEKIALPKKIKGDAAALLAPFSVPDIIYA